MSEHDDGDEATTASLDPPRTGSEEVDEALREVAEALGGTPAEQVPALERAHERLRHALETSD